MRKVVIGLDRSRLTNNAAERALHRFALGRKRDIDLAADLPLCIIGKSDAAGLSNSFKAGGNVDAVTEDAIDDDIGDMNSDTERDFDFLL